jgi:hypothetical protein
MCGGHLAGRLTTLTLNRRDGYRDRTKAHELERLLPWNRKAERLAAAVHA